MCLLIEPCVKSCIGRILFVKDCGGKLYCVSEKGSTFVLSADRNLELLETNRLDAGCLASPAVADGALYLRTTTHLYRLGAK